MAPNRILHVVTTMDYGGVETLLMSIYRNIDREKVQFDFLCHNHAECKFHDEIIRLGGRIFAIPGPSHTGLIQYDKNLYCFFKKHPEYHIIHAHINERNGEVLKMAQKAGIPNRISHSHVASPDHSLLRAIYSCVAKWWNRNSMTHGFACSNDAGRWLFGRSKAYSVLPNAIAINNFTFNQNQRNCIRGKFGIDEQTVLLGHVGRFSEEKNHTFLISLLEKIKKQNVAAKLLLIGAGELEDEIRKLVCQKGLEESVIFAGQHADLGRYYSAMDVFVFPSKFEGLGIVAVEAQCSGLPVIASDGVPSFAKVTDRMQFLPLDASIEKWSDAVMCAANAGRKDREKYASVVAESPYNIKKTAEKLQMFYLSFGSES